MAEHIPMPLRHLTLLALALLPSCTAATFQPVDWPRSGPPSEARTTGAWELGVMRNAHGVRSGPGGFASTLRFAVTTRDTWDSAILRWFTPLEENVAEFWTLFTLEPAEVEVQLGDGLRWQAAERNAEVSGWTEVYVDSLHRYFLLPLLEFDMYGSLEAGTADGQAYRRLWAAYGEDEFVLWTLPDTGQLHYAEFTFRGVGRSYTGVLEYPTWTEFPSTDGWETRLLPTTVLVRNEFGGSVVHQLDFEVLENPYELLEDGTQDSEAQEPEAPESF
ncbi:MAG: hypothetical protein CMJ94_11420 [Planctomycetes bacterium]|nr:hypothetical protein [Planctomycetota bacterium]